MYYCSRVVADNPLTCRMLQLARRALAYLSISSIIIYLSNKNYFYKNKTPDYHVAACEEGPGIFAHFLTGISLLLVAAMLPFSLIFVVKVVQVRKVRRVCQ